MPSVLTKPGTRKLSEIARVVVPEGIVTTGYPSVRDKCRDLGIVHDDWQQGLGRLILGKRADGKYAATVGGIGMSIPRQVGKTFLVGSIIVGLSLIFPGMTVLWTAHRTRTSNETFQKMKGITARPRVKPYMLKPRSVNGEQEIRFRNGSRILFGAREAGFGRGFDEVDVIVFDESQILTERSLEDMIPATNQSRHPAGALLFYMGTPPRPIDPGEVFTSRRVKALGGKTRDAIWVEMGAELGADPDDREQWAKANPSYPQRTPLESMLRLRENLGSDEAWLREGLGIWDDDGLLTAIPLLTWADLCDGSDDPAPHVGPVWLGVDTNPERTRTTIAAAGMRADGFPMVEVTASTDGTVDNRVGVDWAKARVIEICARNDVAAVVIDKRSAAAFLIQAFEDANIPVIGTDSAAFGRSWGQFYAAATETAAIRHLGQPVLTDALKCTGLRVLGEAVVPDRKRSTDDITPLIAAQLAFYGQQNDLGVAKNAGSGRMIALN